jgi:hypothetical protein
MYETYDSTNILKILLSLLRSNTLWQSIILAKVACAKYKFDLVGSGKQDLDLFLFLNLYRLESEFGSSPILNAGSIDDKYPSMIRIRHKIIRIHNLQFFAITSVVRSKDS